MTFDIDGRTLAHTVRGEGPTLVLIHGIVHRQHAWDSVVDELARHRRVVTVDLPGHGDSPDLPTDEFDLGPWIVVELERFLEQVSEGGEKPHVAGNSLGGYFALELAARGSVASATALSPAGFFRGHWDQTRALLVFRSLRALSRLIHPIAPAVMRSVVGRTVANAVFYAKPWRVPVAAATIDALSITTNRAIDAAGNAVPRFSIPVDEDVPVTVAWGRRDWVLPVYQAPLVKKTFPQAQVRTYPGLGHVPMTDDPALVAAILLQGSSSARSTTP
ncbi:alpha/beta fold hydrolase [Rhodococcus sp. IEGM 1354]|uniref:alpha/beta fold hydrolase n=1 Tax=Rhodococcus sp. IEGM 1354 TaxID=3047088 RepID=UPI0024B6CB3F|nr:alpha/beta fold hydrolase [Rhodococcus sp. IEGM 1354]MDI9929593.1 alpha/beta fold hydrolase [Rhodococcus sp. IEGM 1354]